uniref:probable G-protein coupled receptor 139 n=1 Tax=Pristiophorus japonicus TaxID=55135 RepID=UPI00398E5B49
MGQLTMLQIKAIYYPILAVIGVPANLVTIDILSRRNCGLSKCISVYMIAMAAVDLLVMIVNVMLYNIFSNRFPLSFLSHTPVCKFILYMTTVNLDLSVWFTVSFTFDRFVVICCQKFKTKYCTVRTAAMVITAFTVLIFLKNIPVLLAFEPYEIINKVHWGCVTSVAFVSSPPGAAYVWFHSAWGVWFPFTLIALLNSLTGRRILVASRSRRGLRGHRSEKQSDSEMENRKKSIILLFAISGSFVLLWLTSAVSLVTTRLASINYYRGDRTDPGYIATETGLMLKFLSCFQNPCIYAATQRKFREELKTVVKSPWTFILSRLNLGFRVFTSVVDIQQEKGEVSINYIMAAIFKRSMEGLLKSVPHTVVFQDDILFTVCEHSYLQKMRQKNAVVLQIEPECDTLLLLASPVNKTAFVPHRVYRYQPPDLAQSLSSLPSWSNVHAVISRK